MLWLLPVRILVRPLRNDREWFDQDDFLWQSSLKSVLCFRTESPKGKILRPVRRPKTQAETAISHKPELLGRSPRTLAFGLSVRSEEISRSSVSRRDGTKQRLSSPRNSTH